MKCKLLVVLASGLFPGGVYAGDIHKCVAPDGKVSYSDSPCQEAKQIQSVGTPRLKLERLSGEQADIAFDCMEAVDNVVNRVPGKLLIELRESEKTRLIKEFTRFCPALGFQSPLGESTKQFNIGHSKTVKEALEMNGHTGPSFQRFYARGRRDPPLFSTSTPASLVPVAVSDEWPFLRSGLWRFDAEGKGKREVREECQNIIEFLREAAADVEIPGCRRTPLRKTGDKYRFDFQCEMPDSGTSPQRSNGRFVVTTVGPDSFTAELLAEKNGRPWIEHLDARRVSDCKKNNAIDIMKNGGKVPVISGTTIIKKIEDRTHSAKCCPLYDVRLHDAIFLDARTVLDVYQTAPPSPGSTADTISRTVQCGIALWPQSIFF